MFDNLQVQLRLLLRRAGLASLLKGLCAPCESLSEYMLGCKVLLTPQIGFLFRNIESALFFRGLCIES